MIEKNNGEYGKQNKTIKRLNIILEYDENIGSAYIYLPPYSNKKPPRVKSTGEYGENVKFDYDEYNKLAGIEILNGRDIID
jgi:uncharacterized protein YuzE